MDSQSGKNTKNELKIIVIGDSGTGKTSFVNKWTKDSYSETYKPTIVSEFAYKIFEFKGKFYRIQIWDLAGQDKNTAITKIFSKDSHGCLVLCDITNKETLEDTLKWKGSVDEIARFLDGGMLPCVLVQNKIDLVDESVAKDEDEIKKFADENKFDNYFRTSVKMGIGIDECMEYLIKNIIERSEKINKDGEKNLFEKDKKNMVLERKKPNENNNNRSMKNGCC